MRRIDSTDDKTDVYLYTKDENGEYSVDITPEEIVLEISGTAAPHGDDSEIIRVVGEEARTIDQHWEDGRTLRAIVNGMPLEIRPVPHGEGDKEFKFKANLDMNWEVEVVSDPSEDRGDLPK